MAFLRPQVWPYQRAAHLHQDPVKAAVLALLYLTAIGYGLFVSTVGAMAFQSADLYATWIAGEFMHMGRLDQIYPAASPLFDMTTPSDWWAHVSATDDQARIFPYIYPPIWMKIVSYLTTVTTFSRFDAVFLVIHQGALLGSVFLASRMGGFRGMTQFAVVSLSYTALVFMTPIVLAIGENQPQILVSFLIVFAFERAHFGHNRTAGGLLALAAAIKLYPVLFVVIFIARRQWTAVAAFVAIGGALGLLSIAMVGWPIHAEYLALIKTLSNSVIVTNLSFSIDAYLSGTIFSDDLVQVRPLRDVVSEKGWSALGKPSVWVTISAVANLLALCLIAFIAARRPHEPLVLPVAAILLAMLSPLSWAYTYLTAFVFLGILPSRLGWPAYVLLGLAAIYFSRGVNMAMFGMLDYGLTVGWLISGGMILCFGATFTWAIMRPNSDQ